VADDQMLKELSELGHSGVGERSALWAVGEIERLRRVKHRLYEIQLSLGVVFHALSNEDDAGLGAELLEPINVRF